MSNRNFDSRVVIQRLRDKNMAQNFAQFQQNGQSIINNPQTSDPSPQRIGQYYDGAGTAYEQNLLGSGYTVDLGATANFTPSIIPPSPPTNLSATAGNASLSIAFTAGNIGTGLLVNYEYSIDGGVTFTAFSPAQTASPVTISGLENGITYTIALKTVTTAGTSTASATTTGTPVSPATAPGAPTSLIGTPGDSQVSVAFTAPASDGGSPITNYQYSTNNGSSYTAVSPDQTTSPIVITGLTNGTTYTVRLKAVNAVGASTASSSISVTPAGTPPAPTALSGVGGDQAIYVLFTQSSNGGSAITNYEYSVDNGATFTAFSPAQTFSPVMISGIGLTNGTSYNVALKAVNATGAGPASDIISVTPTTNTLLSASRLINLDATNSSSYSGSGTTWTNLDSGGSYSATLLNGPAYDTSTPTNKYFTFDGVNQIAEIAAAAAINPTTALSFTVQIWARVNTASPNFGSGDGLISKQLGSTGDYDGYSLSLNTNNSLYLKMNGSSVDGTYSSIANVWDDNWILYTIVVDFGGGSGSPSYAYVSTRRVATGNNGESFMPRQAALQFPRGIQDSTFNFCPADVGAFYLYNTILTQAQIIQNYDATKARYGL